MAPGGLPIIPVLLPMVNWLKSSGGCLQGELDGFMFHFSLGSNGAEVPAGFLLMQNHKKNCKIVW
jgi:hypothetical protein